MKRKNGARVCHLNGVFSGFSKARTSSLKYNQSFGPGSLQRMMKGRMCNGPWTERKERLMDNGTTIMWNFNIPSKLIVGPLRHGIVKTRMRNRAIDYFLNQDVAYLDSLLSWSICAPSNFKATVLHNTFVRHSKPDATCLQCCLWQGICRRIRGHISERFYSLSLMEYTHS